MELQEKFDQLEELGVFKRLEDIGISIEYLNPSFLVKKPSGGHRLVTAFADVGRYSKPQPSVMPDVDSTLRHIAQWKHLIATDLTSAFYQIPLSQASMKYCGVATPFKGVRVYVRSAMGMPGSETTLEELMCRVLGNLLQEGIVVKLADDLYCGGNTPYELLENWKKVLQALYQCDLRLSASKTVVNPTSTTILGWIWRSGTLQASPHRITTLASCPAPETVARMRSFIGAYKVLARVLPNCSRLMAPLDDIVAGRQSNETISWSDDLRTAFKDAQLALSNNRTITLPKPDDLLWIVTDGAVRPPGIGATLYVTRGNKLHLAGFFRAKLRGSQVSWLPCEIEALSIATATKHFSPYIIQSNHNACILTDSKPCVQAFEKLCRGEFSASPRVSTFLSVVSRFQASVRHVSGAAILPSDFASRNAPPPPPHPCQDVTCQVCAVPKSLWFAKLLSRHSPRPCEITFHNPCILVSHPVRVQRSNVKDVKRYLNVATIAKDRLLVVKRDEPFTRSRECIIVPRQVLDGLLTALHIQLSHPSSHQLKMVTKRYLFALDMDKAIERVVRSCTSCAALSQTPQARIEQSSCEPPDAVGISFAADVLKRSIQLILVLREFVTSYTSTMVIEDERHHTLRDALVRLCIQLRPLDGPPAVIRTDPAPGFKSLVNDQLLKHHRIVLKLGNPKNPNKNPVAERAVQELEIELLRQDPLGGAVSEVTLAVATDSRIRSRGLSSREMWSQRDQFSNRQLPMPDEDLITKQHDQRLINHPHSMKSKAPLALPRPTPGIEIGDLVYIHSDRNKSRARDRYLVTNVEGAFCNVRKFIGSQLRSTSYRIKKSECYHVPGDLSAAHSPQRPDDSSGDEEDPIPQTTPPAPPEIPSAISLPADQHVPESEDTDFSMGPSTSEPVDLPSDHTAERQFLPSESVNQPRRSARQRRRPARYDDYVTDF